ncbi:MAG: hypothetical protein ACW98D_16610 [Promethearchaeota archaeon]|jgi:hypothetical protein
MSLKCHLCGKEYYHDRKVCPSCEEIASSSLLSQSGIDTKKWRCDNFLELKSLPFGSNEKLENYDNDWNFINTVKFDKTEMNKTKINHFLRFE